jgi:hypothetical protein
MHWVIYIGVMFSLQARSLGDNVRVFSGADITINAVGYDDSLREEEMRRWLDQQIQRRVKGESNAPIVDYTFITYNMRLVPIINM